MEEFLEGLEGDLLQDGARMWALLEHVARNGPPRDAKLVRKLAKGIFEFRKGRIRIAWFPDAGGRIICSHGFVKKSQKTKDSDIGQAKRIRDLYFKEEKAGRIQWPEEGASEDWK